MKSTNKGALNIVPNCSISIPNAGVITMFSLPEISDSKSAVYNNEAIIGRSFPLYTYAYSGDRTISMQIHFFIVNKGDGTKNINSLRMIQSAVYPRVGKGGAPFIPPVVCTLRCGELLGERQNPLCAVLQSYSVRFPTDVAWDIDSFCPFKFDVDTNWLVVYTSSDLPYADRILKSGR